MFLRYIVCLAMTLMLGCAGNNYPLDGQWTVVRDKTELQRKQRLGAVDTRMESQDEWHLLSTARFEIHTHSQLNIRLQEEKLRTLPIRVRELEPNLWMIQARHAEQSFQMKAARVDDELRVLDSGYLFVLEQK